MRDLDYRWEVVCRRWRQRGIRNLESWNAGGRTLFFRITSCLKRRSGRASRGMRTALSAKAPYQSALPARDATHGLEDPEATFCGTGGEFVRHMQDMTAPQMTLDFEVVHPEILGRSTFSPEARHDRPLQSLL